MIVLSSGHVNEQNRASASFARGTSVAAMRCCHMHPGGGLPSSGTKSTTSPPWSVYVMRSLAMTTVPCPTQSSGLFVASRGKSGSPSTVCAGAFHTRPSTVSGVIPQCRRVTDTLPGGGEALDGLADGAAPRLTADCEPQAAVTPTTPAARTKPATCRRMSMRRSMQQARSRTGQKTGAGRAGTALLLVQLPSLKTVAGQRLVRGSRSHTTPSDVWTCQHLHVGTTRGQLDGELAAVPVTRGLRYVLIALVGLLVAAVVSACGGDTAQESARPAPTTATPAPASADPAAVAATAVAEQFLTALVDEDHDVAYNLLSNNVRSSLTLEQFAAARQAKNASARSIGRRYELMSAAGDERRRTVEGEAFLADGTVVEIKLPMTQTPDGWRVDAQPTNY
jgi:hypothetical protein